MGYSETSQLTFLTDFQDPVDETKVSVQHSLPEQLFKPSPNIFSNRVGLAIKIYWVLSSNTRRFVLFLTHTTEITMFGRKTLPTKSLRTRVSLYTRSRVLLYNG